MLTQFYCGFFTLNLNATWCEYLKAHISYIQTNIPFASKLMNQKTTARKTNIICGGLHKCCSLYSLLVATSNWRILKKNLECKTRTINSVGKNQPTTYGAWEKCLRISRTERINFVVVVVVATTATATTARNEGGGIGRN